MPTAEEIEAQAMAALAAEHTRLVKIRASIKSRLTVIQNYVNGFTAVPNLEITTISELQARSAKLNDVYKEYLAAQQNIDMLYQDVPFEQLEERDKFDRAFFKVESQIKLLLSQNHAPLGASAHSSAQGNEVRVKLPEIKLPVFNGNIENWLEFRDLYESMVHTRSSIDNITKFHYLRSSLTGDAALLVSSLEFSHSAYIEAWRLLCNRYNNTKLLVHNHVKSIFAFEVMQKESASKIRSILDNLAKHLAALKVLKEPTDQWDTLLIYVITSKLDAVTSRDWEQYQMEQTNTITLRTLITFLENKATVIESLRLKRAEPQSSGGSNSSPNFHAQQNKSKSGNGNVHKARSFAAVEANCPQCNGSHAIADCKAFLSLLPVKRYHQARLFKLCINCLKSGHQNTRCKCKGCATCARKHNSLLHFETSAPQQESKGETEKTGQLVTATCNATAKTAIGQTLLATAIVHAVGKDGVRHKLRALLDSGSQASFITTDAFQRLGIASIATNASIHGFNQSESRINSRCELEIQSRCTPHKFVSNFLITSSITSNLPTLSFDLALIKMPSNIVLADPTFNKTAKIDLLLGAECFWDLILIDQHKIGPNLPIMRDTKLGWVLAGPTMPVVNAIVCNLSRIDLDRRLATFWEVEEINEKRHLTVEEEICERQFVETTRRNEEGRFIVKLPLQNVESLGASRDIAERRFRAMERKLQRNNSLRDEYTKFMREYIDLKHMVKVSDPARLTIQPNFYLPHHAVHNLNSSTTKVRVVFDGSARTSTGVSFNECQYVGPTIQDELFAILLRFRKYAYVATADISKMYRQTLIEPEQTQLQRILWRFDPQDDLDTFELQTVTYGTACAAFLAIRCLHKLADDIKDTLPHIAHRIKKDFYVDDLLTGASDADTLIENCNLIEKTLLSGCLELRKWRSNNALIADKSECKDTSLVFDNDGVSKTLGLTWNSPCDQFTFSVSSDKEINTPTKRVMLSKIAKIFDPLGLVAPCIIVGKMLLQTLWLEKISWDSPLPHHLCISWKKFYASLMYLNNVTIPRQVRCGENYTNLQLHGFSDASNTAYGACLYIRATSPQGNNFCSLLCAKSKVAPLKTVSIPRLELCAAVLLVRLIKKALEVLEQAFDEIYAWTDSAVVLGWVKTQPFKLATFVSNRVAEIQGATEIKFWRHVPTKCNPADMLSRGITAVEIENSDLWWSGPAWLRGPCAEWPVAKFNHENLPELRNIKLNTQAMVTACEPFPVSFERFSSMEKLCRVVARVFRFVGAVKTGKQDVPPHITIKEMRDAEQRIVKAIQRQEFAAEIASLERTNSLPAQSTSMCKLSPFLDSQGVLRVGGRLGNGDFALNQTHPIILPKHHVTHLIFQREHQNLLHIAPLGLLNAIRLKYWPIAGRSIARQTVHRCVTCFKAKPRPFPTPIMGQLPKPRVSESPPFTHCGVDYAGPVDLKLSHARNSKTGKAYIALFVCLSVKAVHLELLTSLSTDAFMAMLRRFAARRGMPLQLYSDNGTNFVGANRELGSFLKKNKEHIEKICADEKFSWKFIPPRSPNFGGLWEAGVKSTKHHLHRVIGGQILNFENYCTLLAQIESILNSRPISPLSADPNDLAPLTPGHFLIGRPLVAVPDEDVTEVADNRLSKFQLMQKMVQSFWQRWRRDYVNTLQQRTKWTKKGITPKIGQLVIIADEQIPVLRWIMGRITEIHPGRDDIVRVASVKTAKGTLKRALTKLCPLPTDELEQN